MNKRMLAALIAFVGVFVATYLALYKLGYVGTLVCAVGSCEVVQTSRWATLFGAPVAVWGVGYYVAILAAELAGLSPSLADDPRLSALLVIATGIGLVFSAWLTYLELFVIHAICIWCVGSAVLATALFVVCWLDLREFSGPHADADEIAAIAAARLRGAGWGKGIRNTEELSLRALESPDE